MIYVLFSLIILCFMSKFYVFIEFYMILIDNIYLQFSFLEKKAHFGRIYEFQNCRSHFSEEPYGPRISASVNRKDGDREYR